MNGHDPDYTCRHPDFVVTVASASVPPGPFAVRGKVLYSRRLSLEARGRVETAAALATYAGILRALERGLARGVRRGALEIDGDCDLAGALKRLARRPEPPPLPTRNTATIPAHY